MPDPVAVPDPYEFPVLETHDGLRRAIRDAKQTAARLRIAGTTIRSAGERERIALLLAQLANVAERASERVGLAP